ncbi:MAG: alpha/beta hydrolase, partial [Mycobacterium sp.]|nr:alpha/beta hydrolase [Mycobacterium sp.]
MARHAVDRLRFRCDRIERGGSLSSGTNAVKSDEAWHLPQSGWSCWRTTSLPWAGVECLLNGVTVHFVEYGAGVPLIALHGAGVDHREIEVAVEAIVPDRGYRRIYPDLPGMGCSTSDGLACNDDVVQLLGAFIDDLGEGPALLVGHSYGAYLARGVAAQRPDVVAGLALVCPVAERSQNVPSQHVVHQDDEAYHELEPAQWAGF